MSEILTYAPSQEGLTALDSFVERNIGYDSLLPFTLPVRSRIGTGRRRLIFDYYLNTKTGVTQSLRFSLTENQVADLRDVLYAIPGAETTRGQNPYYWLNIHAIPDADSPVLTSCRLRPEEETHKIDFLYWHGLGEQLLADYTMGINNLRFFDLLPFSLVGVVKNHLRNYQLAALPNLLIQIDRNSTDGDTLRFVPKTDDQRLYEWFDILNVVPLLAEEKWPLLCSYRIRVDEHRIYSRGWLGSERQLLIDRIQRESNIGFVNLRSIRTKATSGGKTVYLFTQPTTKPKGCFNVVRGVLAQNEETISIPRQDEYGIYEWLELYRYDPATNGPTGEVLTSGRITPEGINQKEWPGIEIQFLKDYTNRLVKFDSLKPITIQVHKGRHIHLFWIDDRRVVTLTLSRRLRLKLGDYLTLIPEKETEEGTDFLLVKDDTTLARYRLDLKTKKITCVNLLVNNNESLAPAGWMNRNAVVGELRMLSGLKLNYNHVNAITNESRVQHPEWFRFYLDSTRKSVEHYAPEMVEIIRGRIRQQQIKRITSEATVIETQLDSDNRIAQVGYLSLSQDQAWEVADKYWEYAQANPDCRMDIPEYYARVYLVEQGEKNEQN